MILRFCLSAISLVSSLNLVAQGRVFLTATAGQYSMRTLKELQDDLHKQFLIDGIEMEIVTSFPISLQVDAGYLKKFLEQYSGGVYLNYAMTKGRLHYADYSGETYADQIVSRVVIGGKGINHLSNGFALYAKLAFNYSMLNMEFAATIHGAGMEQQSLRFFSYGFNAEPGVSWTYRKRKLSFDVNAGYEFNVQGKTVFKEDTSAYLKTEAGDKVIINWSGIRMGIGINYHFI